MKDFKLPDSFVALCRDAEATKAQTDELTARLVYLTEVAENIDDWLGGANKDSWKDFISELELDLSVNQNIPKTEKNISNWLIHDSWTFDFSPKELAGCLRAEFLSVIDGRLPSVQATEIEFRQWLRGYADMLKYSLSAFQASVSAAEAMAYYIAIDILVARLLSETYCCRLNKNFL